MLSGKGIISIREAIREIIAAKLMKGHERSVLAKKNIVASMIYRGASIVISLILVPLSLDYINVSQYGIWLTVSSIVGWFSFFDIGLSQGLRNKFAEAKAKGNELQAKIYVSTTYALLIIIFFFVWLAFLFVNRYIDWAGILNIDQEMRQEVSVLALIVFTYFCITFVLRIITSILTANQQPAKTSLIDFLGQALSMIFISIMVITTKGSLVKLGLALCTAPLVVLVLANLFFFRESLREYRPQIKFVKFRESKGLLNLSLAFFVIQIAGIVQFQTANLIIAKNFSTMEVTSYNIVMKYFGVLYTIFIIFITPFWSASTDAFFKDDFKWIQNGIRRYNQLNIVMLLTGIIMLLVSSPVYSLWLGEGKVDIAFSMSLWGFIYYNVVIFGSKYVNFLNGINALKIQLWSSIVSPFIFIFAAITFIHFWHMKAYSLFLASVIANFNAFILAPLQYYKIIIKNKRGFWVK